MFAYSYQAKDAGTPIRVQIGIHLCACRVRQRGPGGLLRVLPHDTHDDNTVHRRPIHRLRAAEEADESEGGLFARDAHDCRRTGGRCSSGRDDAAGRRQDDLADEGHFT